MHHASLSFPFGTTIPVDQKASNCEDQPLFLMWDTSQAKPSQAKPGDDYYFCWIVSPHDGFCVNGRTPGFYFVNKQASANEKGASFCSFCSQPPR